MSTQNLPNVYQIRLPTKGKGKKEIDSLFRRRREQTIKAINKLRKNPTDYKIKGIEKISDNRLGQFTIRVSKGDRIFYDVDNKKKIVYLLRAGKHDHYRLI